VRVDGSFTNVFVRRLRAGSDAMVVGGTMSNLFCDGASACRGEIRCKANTTLGTLNLLDVAPSFRLTSAGTSDITTLNMTGGTVEHDGDRISTANVAGGTLVMLGSSDALTITAWKGATIDYQASGTLATANVRGGTLTFARNRSTSVTLTTLNLSAGLVDLRNNLDNLTVTNNPTVNGGRLLTDQGVTTDPKA
jgi:hypothetical protein